MSVTRAGCLACFNDGKRSQIQAEKMSVSFDPAVDMPGQPTVTGTRICAWMIAEAAWEKGVAYVHGPKMYPHLTKGQVLVACWWVGLYGGRRVWTKRWKAWAEAAGWHLWYRCTNVPPLPTASGGGP